MKTRVHRCRLTRNHAPPGATERIDQRSSEVHVQILIYRHERLREPVPRPDATPVARDEMAWVPDYGGGGKGRICWGGVT